MTGSIDSFKYQDLLTSLKSGCFELDDGQFLFVFCEYYRGKSVSQIGCHLGANWNKTNAIILAMKVCLPVKIFLKSFLFAEDQIQKGVCKWAINQR